MGAPEAPGLREASADPSLLEAEAAAYDAAAVEVPELEQDTAGEETVSPDPGKTTMWSPPSFVSRQVAPVWDRKTAESFPGADDDANEVASAAEVPRVHSTTWPPSASCGAPRSPRFPPSAEIQAAAGALAPLQKTTERPPPEAAIWPPPASLPAMPPTAENEPDAEGEVAGLEEPPFEANPTAEKTMPTELGSSTPSIHQLDLPAVEAGPAAERAVERRAEADAEACRLDGGPRLNSSLCRLDDVAKCPREVRLMSRGRRWPMKTSSRPRMRLRRRRRMHRR